MAKLEVFALVFDIARRGPLTVANRGPEKEQSFSFPDFSQPVLSRSQKFDLVSIQDCCTGHNGTLPKQSGTTAAERSLVQWLSHKLHSHRRGKLPDEQLATLRKSPWVREKFAIDAT